MYDDDVFFWCMMTKFDADDNGDGNDDDVWLWCIMMILMYDCDVWLWCMMMMYECDA